MKTCRAAVLIASMAVAVNGMAQDTEHCNPDGNQAQMNACARDDFAVADRELNRVYKALAESLAPESKAVLLREQRAWLKTRDPKCRQEADDVAEGGSMWPLIYDGCRARSTQARVKTLKKWQKLSRE